MKNGTSVLSIHLDQVSARSVGWPLVYFFLLNCPFTCCLDLFFHLQNFSIYYPFFNIIGPACHCGRSRLFTFPTPFSLHSIGPACHCGRSRLSLSSTFSTPSPFLNLIGPACHCGRSRLFLPLPSPHQSLPTYRPGLSLWQVPPISFLYLPHTNLSPSYRPGLSLWQVPPISFLFLLHTSPFLYLIGPACHCGRSRQFPDFPSCS